jgi:hypothetical protein
MASRILTDRREAAELFERLVLPGKNSAIVAGAEHDAPTVLGDIHPDNAFAAAVLRDFFPRNLPTTPRLIEVNPAGNIVYTGSPTSSAGARGWMGYQKVGPGMYAYTRDHIIKLDYHYVHDLEPGSQVKRWLVRNDKHLEHSVKLSGIQTPLGTLVPNLDEDSALQTDFLLITRLPNFVDQSRLTSVVVIGGPHGIGTRALAKLRRSHTALSRIEESWKEAGKPSHYQVLLRIPGVVHSRLRRTSEPAGIEFDPRYPVVPVTLSAPGI